MPGPSLLSSSTQESSAKVSAPNKALSAPQAPTPPKPNYDPFSSIASSDSNSRSITPAPASLSQPQQPSKAPHSTSDPFAALSAPSKASAPSPSPSLFDFSSSHQKPANQTPASEASAIPSQQPLNGTSNNNSDDWEFASALPEEPLTNDVVVSRTAVTIVLNVSRRSDDSIGLVALFTNNTASFITEYTFQIAVTKGFTLNLKPQSGRNLQPNQIHGIQQTILVNGVARGQANNVKMRWKASYKIGGEAKQELGEVPSLGIT